MLFHTTAIGDGEAYNPKLEKGNRMIRRDEFRLRHSLMVRLTFSRAKPELRRKVTLTDLVAQLDPARRRVLADVTREMRMRSQWCFALRNVARPRRRRI